MSHPDPLRLQASFDGEMDAMETVEIEAHLQQCEQCQAQWRSLEAVRTGLRRELPYEAAPDALRLRLEQLLAQEDSTRAPAAAPASAARPARLAWLRAPFWLGGLSGGAVVAAAAAFIVMSSGPRVAPLQDELVSAHVRSMMSGHAIDVVSSDHHTVKPWFAGHADVSPVVADFDTQGYRLIGGRADYLDHQRAAVMVYQHGAHTIDVFSWAAGPNALPTSADSRDGYHIICWRSKDLSYCAVSDTGLRELRALAGLLQASAGADAP
ncbi:MAG TPA: zf-HC2 domain-containing protein [Steroidobacteraceae bacterium]|jgi:anti-sigma factor RsiW|nr:zf-HC2 domain-containing protein [Steroidobacteraceae bacterium]